MNEKTLGIILGIVFTIIIAVVSISLFLLFINYNQSEFFCGVCEMNCSTEDVLQWIKPAFFP